MANTEGIPDEKLASLLSIPMDGSTTTGIATAVSASTSATGITTTTATTTKRNKLPRGLIERQRMMDEFEMSMNSDDRIRPSATVIRSSGNRNRPPVVKSTSKSTSNSTSSQSSSRDNSNPDRLKKVSFMKEGGGNDISNENDENDNENREGNDREYLSSPSSTPKSPPPILLSNSIKERPIHFPKSSLSSSSSSSFTTRTTSAAVVQLQHNKKKQHGSGNGKGMSRFKSSMKKQQEEQNKQQQQKDREKDQHHHHQQPHHKTGFPSFDRPVGSLTRKGRNRSRIKQIVPSQSQTINKDNGDGETNMNMNMNTTMKTKTKTETEADSMIANMTSEEILEGVAEIKNMLSPETIQFLKNRKTKKDRTKDKGVGTIQTLSKGTVDNDDHGHNDNDNEKFKAEKEHELQRIHMHDEAEAETIETVVSKSNLVQNHKIIMSGTTTTGVGTTASESQSESHESHDPSKFEKEQMAQVLSSIQTEDELDELFAKTIGMHDKKVNGDGGNDNDNTNNDINDDVDSGGTVETELETATKLLRSTALRQRVLGAKRIYEILEGRFRDIIAEGGTSATSKGPIESKEKYPILMPVALRCLLDLPSPTKHSILFSYILRSLHVMVLLFSHPENCVYDNSSNSIPSSKRSVCSDIVDPSTIYQLYFMKDHVPTPSASRLYTNSTTKPSPMKGENNTATTNGAGAGCYATNSSAESAEKDGGAFYADPLWTLLSRMRILPCLSHILKSYSTYKNKASQKRNSNTNNSNKNYNNNNNNNNNIADNNTEVTADSELEAKEKEKTLLSDISVETLNAICSILSMLSIRSPGAACAIAQHKDIMSCIISATFEPVSHGNLLPTALTLPAIRLICTLCRQSRTIALSNWMSSVMEYVTIILAISAEHEDEWEMQKWCIILWRIMLQYGLAISYTPTILTLSIPHLTTKDDRGYSLSSYYLTSYAALCDCVKAFANSDQAHNLTLDEGDRQVLGGCSIWLASHLRCCAEFLTQSVLPISDEEVMKTMCLASARVRLLTSFTAALDVTKNQLSNTSAMIPLVSRNSFIQALIGVFRSKLLYKAIDIALDQSQKNCEVEASACGLVHSFFTALCSLLRQDDQEFEPKEEAEDKELLHLVTDIFTHVLEILAMKSSLRQNIMHFDNNSCIRSWRNKAHFSIGRMMAITLSIRSSILGIESVRLALPLIQSFVFTLIGRLDHGEEAMAAMLTSQSILFNVVITEEGTTSFQSVRYVQEVLLREIIDTSHQSQVQLDHSFKLLSGHEMSHSGGGSFQLESLRSEADRFTLPPQSTASDAKNDSSLPSEILSLPLGDDWLFKLLSGNIDLGNSPHQKIGRLQCTSEIIFSAFRLIVYMEKEKTQYANSTPSGAKIYFLLNSCLFPEDIVRQDLFGPLFHELFQMYEPPNESKEGDKDKARSFILTCFNHSTEVNNHHQDSLSEDQVLQLFYDHPTSSTTDGNKKAESSPRCMKAVDDFVSDICTAFLNYGAQYDIFTRSIRFLLNSGFPSRNRIILLNTLKDLLHLLTTEDEMEKLVLSLSSPETNFASELALMQYHLKRSLSGGLPMQDGSSRDSSELLDTIASLLKRNKYNTLESAGFFYLYGTGYLARNLASSAVRCECGLNAMKQRFLLMAKGGMNHNVLDDIVSIAFTLMEDSIGSVDSLAKAIIETCCNCDNSKKSSCKWEESWETMVLDLREAFSSAQKINEER